MKVLFVATVRSHIGQFHMPFIKALKEAGHEVHAAFKDNSADKKGLDLSAIDQCFEVPFERSPFRPKNVAAYKILKKIIDQGQYDVVHCHTPVGSVLTRLAAIDARKKGTKVVYTAHGFHFYKGAPKKYWLTFYNIEKMLAKYTDLLITINQQDYDNVINRKFSVKKAVKVNGVGVDLTKFAPVDEQKKAELRQAYGYNSNDFILFYAADLSKNKNQQMILKAVAHIKSEIPNLKVLLAGQPTLKAEYEQLCKEYGISHMVSFLGYRRDIKELLCCSDAVVSSSRREGLPINLIEAAACGKYIIATNVRGHADVVNQVGYGTLVPLDDHISMGNEILKFYREGAKTNTDVSKVEVFNVESVVAEMLKIYEDLGAS